MPNKAVSYANMSPDWKRRLKVVPRTQGDNNYAVTITFYCAPLPPIVSKIEYLFKPETLYDPDNHYQLDLPDKQHYVRTKLSDIPKERPQRHVVR